VTRYPLVSSLIPNGEPPEPSPVNAVSCCTEPDAAVVAARAGHDLVAVSQPSTCEFVGDGAFTSGRSSNFADDAKFTPSSHGDGVVPAPPSDRSNTELSATLNATLPWITYGSDACPDPVIEIWDPEVWIRQAHDAPPQHLAIGLNSQLN
jgi:hypothetical protein